MDNKKIIIGIVIAWVFIIVYNASNFFGDDNNSNVVTKKNRKSSSVSRSVKSGVDRLKDFPKLNTSLLTEKKKKYPGVYKNIFAFGAPPKPKVEPKVVEPIVEEPVVEPPTPPTAIEVFIAQLSFMGFLEKGEHKTLFLAFGDDVFLVKVGEVLQDRFMTESITNKKIIFKDIQTSEEKVFSLTQ